MQRQRIRGRLSRPMQLLLAPGMPLTAWLERLATLQLVDRGMGIGAQAFTTLIPLLIVYSSVVPVAEGRSFADRLISSLKLSEPTAATVRQAIAPPGAVAEGVTALGVVLLIISALSFARALQRVYETAYGLRASGIRGTPWHLAWIALIPVYVTVRPLVASLGGSWWQVLGSMLLGVLAWLVTPYILLGKRLPARHLLPTALFTAAGMTALGGASLLYLPHSLSASAQQFGTIGIAFAILGWLVAAGFVLVACAAAGAVTLEHLKTRG